MIDKIFPVLTLIFGFALAQFGKYFADRKNDRKKLKKLLFNLLELRWLLKQEIELNEKITKLIERLKIKLKNEFGAESANGADYFKPMITNMLRDSIVKPEKITEIENNIDNTIEELAEIYPIFAYELSGRYKIKEKLNNADEYFQKVTDNFEEFPTEIKDWIEPKISTELISDFDEYIIAIAKKIGRITNKNVSEKLEPHDENDNSELDKFIDEYIAEVKKTMPNNV